MRLIYSILLYLALPFICLRLLWRSRRLPAYRKRIAERFGFYPLKLERSIWVHAVSMGETIAALPLIRALKSRYPTLPILVTTMTPTGAKRVEAEFKDEVTHVYLPYDTQGAVSRFLTAMNPIIGIIMETELWPNLIAACHQKHIPICLVNARLSEKSARGYELIAPLTREMLQRISMIAAHGEQDAKRFIALGAMKNHVKVTGSLKFDLQFPANLTHQIDALRQSLGRERFIWIAASTHEGEEEIILAAQQKIQAIHPHALLILVPRHPDRFDAVAKLCEQSFPTVRRSLINSCQPDTAIYLGDTMGELLLLYGTADVAFVGGSLVPRGGHNVLEPGALGKPILTGPHLFNFAEISEIFFSAQAMQKVNDAESIATALLALMQAPAKRFEMGERAREVVEKNRGALNRQLEIINLYLADHRS